MPPPRTLIITGASRGIGAATALKAARSEYRVVINYAKDQETADQVVEQIRGSGGNAISIRADVPVESDMIALFQEAETRLGPIYGLVNNAATKGAIDTLTIGLAREVANEGIRVNAVSPGLIDTDLHAAAGAPDRLARLGSTIPMQRPGTADEIAGGVRWLLSPEASYVTGTILEIGGGR
jgi:NAD(P)-dependent dehydrogenase (short-subunit alcohol dehydrogenase family)